MRRSRAPLITRTMTDEVDEATLLTAVSPQAASSLIINWSAGAGPACPVPAPGARPGTARLAQLVSGDGCRADHPGQQLATVRRASTTGSLPDRDPAAPRRAGRRLLRSGRHWPGRSRRRTTRRCRTRSPSCARSGRWRRPVTTCVRKCLTTCGTQRRRASTDAASHGHMHSRRYGRRSVAATGSFRSVSELAGGTSSWLGDGNALGASNGAASPRWLKSRRTSSGCASRLRRRLSVRLQAAPASGSAMNV